MTTLRLALACALTALCGCVATPGAKSSSDSLRSVTIDVVSAQEHFGHDISTEGVHTVWCDGCRARDTQTGEPLVIYWINHWIERTPHRFEKGRRYAVHFTGEEQTGVMGYAGRCIALEQVVRVTALSGQRSQPDTGAAPPADSSRSR